MARSKKNSPRTRSRCELVRETPWLRVYRDKSGVYVHEPKLREQPWVNASDFETTWRELSDSQKLDLCIAYQAKVTISSDDEKVLDTIMRDGDDLTWRNIASVLTRYPDRMRVHLFLEDRVDKQAPPLANFYQAMETLGDRRAVPQLHKKYLQYRDSGLTRLDLDHVHCTDYLTCCRALWLLTGLLPYKESIADCLSSESRIIRDTARRLLEK